MIEVIKFEFKKSFRNVFIWASIIGALCAFLMGFFETVKSSAEAIKSLTESLPPELLKAFGTSSFTDIEGYFNGRFLFLFIIMNSVWGAATIAGITGKEINNKNITMLFVRNITRLNIYLGKLSTFLINMILINLVAFVVTLVSISLFTTEDNVSISFFAASFLGALIVQLVFSSIGLLIGVVKNETMAVFSVLGLTIIGFIVDTISRVEGGPEFLKYLTPYFYLDLENTSVIDSLHPERMIVLVIFTIVVSILSYRVFKQKEIQI